MYSLLPASSKAIDRLDWPAIEPWYHELTATALSPPTRLPGLAQWSGLSELVDESGTGLEIAWSQNTANRRRWSRRQRFLETVAPPIRSADQQLTRQLLESGLEPPGFTIPLRNLRAEA